MKYDHAMEIAFRVESNHPDGEDITAAQIIQAVIDRLSDFDDGALVDHCLPPFDSFEIEDEEE